MARISTTYVLTIKSVDGDEFTIEVSEKEASALSVALDEIFSYDAE